MRTDLDDMREELFIRLMHKTDFKPLDKAKVTEERRYYEMTPSIDGKYAALRDLAEVYAAAGSFDDAIAVYTEGLKNCLLQEYYAEFHFRIGQLYEHKEDYTLALEAYLQSISVKEYDGHGRYWQHNNAAFCYLMKKDFEAAEKHCQIAFEADEEFVQRWRHVQERPRWNVWKNMGVVMEHTGRLKEAASYYTTAIKLSNGYERAVLHLRRLLKRHPDLAQAWREPVEDLFKYYKVTV